MKFSKKQTKENIKFLQMKAKELEASIDAEWDNLPNGPRLEHSIGTCIAKAADGMTVVVNDLQRALDKLKEVHGRK